MNMLFDGLTKNIDLQKQFAVMPDETPQRYYTYQAMLDVSARFANFLVSHGVDPGDRVAVQVPKSIEAVMLYLACIRAGAVFLPLNTAYTLDEVAYFLDDAKPKLFICDPKREAEFKTALEGSAIELFSMAMWRPDENEIGSIYSACDENLTQFDNIPRAGNDLAAILYTSGTTGRSKGAMLTHENLLSNALVLKEYWQFTPQDVLLHALPIFHTHGLFVAINIVMVSASSMLFLPEFNVDKIIETLPRANCMMGVPTFYTRLLEREGFNRELVKDFRLFISGSAPLLAETHLAFEKRTGHKILERYGMTETNMNSSNPYQAERRAGSVGFPLPGVEIRITDAETSKALPQGEIGMIEVRGDNVCKGYWQNSEKTKEEFKADGFFITGDLGVFDGDGYLSIVGRSKDLIISGGLNIYPKEIELILDEQEGVVESAVIGVPHRDLGEAVIAILVAQEGVQLDIDQIRQEISTKISRFKLPKYMAIHSMLPRNTMGKVQKNELKKDYLQTFNSKS